MKTLTSETLEDIRRQEGGQAWVETVTLRANPLVFGQVGSGTVSPEELGTDVLGCLVYAGDTTSENLFERCCGTVSTPRQVLYMFCNAEFPCVIPDNQATGSSGSSGYTWVCFGEYQRTVIDRAQLTMDGREMLTCAFGQYYHPYPYQRESMASSEDISDTGLSIGDPDARFIRILSLRPDKDTRLWRLNPLSYGMGVVTFSRHRVLRTADSGTAERRSLTLNDLSGLTLSQMKEVRDTYAGCAACRAEGAMVIGRPEESVSLVVSGVTHTNGVTTLKLRQRTPLSWPFPPRCAYRNVCQWEFCSPECGLSADDHADDVCDKTLASCKGYGNASRYGGFPGIGSGGLS